MSITKEQFEKFNKHFKIIEETKASLTHIADFDFEDIDQYKDEPHSDDFLYVHELGFKKILIFFHQEDISFIKQSVMNMSKKSIILKTFLISSKTKMEQHLN